MEKTMELSNTLRENYEAHDDRMKKIALDENHVKNLKNEIQDGKKEKENLLALEIAKEKVSIPSEEILSKIITVFKKRKTWYEL